MRLKKTQVEQLLTLIGEGLKTDEINKQAEKFDPPFFVSRSQVEHYRKTRQISIDAIRKAGELRGLTEGLATKEARVDLLKKLAHKMRDDLLVEPKNKDDSRWWVHNVKGIGRGDDFQQVDIYEFNASEMRELRGTLEDIAAETGGRVKNVDVKSDGEKVAAITMIEVVKAQQ